LAGLGHGWEEGFEETHEFAANTTLALAAVHVLGVIAESLLHRENLIRSMWTGYKRTDHNDLQRSH
jgi:cytochrome b